MGCDIHLYVEKKNPISGAWKAIKGVNEPEIKDFEEYAEKAKTRGDNADYWLKRIEEEKAGTHDFIWSGRHYFLFSLLANVRNEYGANPISEPKGLPDDVSFLVSEKSAEWGVDGHSHSFLTARELIEFNWDQVVTVEGWVSEQQYKEFKEKGSPSGWCGAVGGGGVQHITNREMDNFIAGKGFRLSDAYYTLINWQWPYTYYARSFHDWSIPKLKELAGDDLDSIRLVFWFDN